MSLDQLLKDVRACTHCSQHLPLGPRPIVRATPHSRILIVGQAPGTRVHESGVPWDDRSGERLRVWLSLSPETFYDEKLVALMPMGFCYPGRQKNGGDAPPRPECAPLWHDRIRTLMPTVELTLLVGSYAQRYYLKPSSKQTMAETIRGWKNHLPDYLLTPHPSWRSTGWMKKHPWFETDILPYLKERVAEIINKS